MFTYSNNMDSPHIMVHSSLESHHISAQNKGKYVLATSIFQTFVGEHVPRPHLQGHTYSVTNNSYTIEDLTLCQQIHLRALHLLAVSHML